MTNILALPYLTVAASTSQDGDCLLQLEFKNNSSPIDLTGIAFSLAWHAVGSNGLRGADVQLSASTAGSYLTNGNTTAILTLNVPAVKMAVLPAGTYLADLIAQADGMTFVCATIAFTHAAFGFCLITSISTVERSAATGQSS